MKLLFLFLLLSLAAPDLNAQRVPAGISLLDSGQHCSIRGMSAPTENTIWVSGSNGHVGRSIDGGLTWRWTIVAGYERTDFRDIHAFDSATALIMGIGNPAFLLKTTDAGRSWRTVFTKDQAGMFLDAVDFRDAREGICIGDPVPLAGGKKTFFILRTHDGGESWTEEAPDKLPLAEDGESVFSASGTNIALLKGADFDYAFISGGLASNLYLIGRTGTPNAAYPLHISTAGESAGAFSMATDRRDVFYCIGGDYKAPDDTANGFTWTEDRGKTWHRPRNAGPGGYRSCVRIVDGKRLVACGSNGVDMRNARGNWKQVSTEGFNVCATSPDRTRIYFAGSKGRIAILQTK